MTTTHDVETTQADHRQQYWPSGVTISSGSTVIAFASSPPMVPPTTKLAPADDEEKPPCANCGHTRVEHFGDGKGGCLAKLPLGPRCNCILYVPKKENQ